MAPDLTPVDPSPLTYLVYISAPTRTMRPEDLESILLTARAHNLSADITGLLILRDDCFIQFLEGPPREIDALMESILADDRHHRVRVHNFPGLITGLAAILTVAAAWANLRLPYWVFVAFLTPAVVLQTSGATRDLSQAIIDRAGYNLVGSAIAIAVLAGGHLYLVRRHGMTDTGATTS